MQPFEAMNLKSCIRYSTSSFILIYTRVWMQLRAGIINNFYGFFIMVLSYKGTASALLLPMLPSLRFSISILLENTK